MFAERSRSCAHNRAATLQALYWLRCGMTGSLRYSLALVRRTNKLIWRRRGLWLGEWDGNGGVDERAREGQ